MTIRASALGAWIGTAVGPMSYWRSTPPSAPRVVRRPDRSARCTRTTCTSRSPAKLGSPDSRVWLWAGRPSRAGCARRAPAADPRLGLAICAGLVASLAQGLFDTIGIVQMTFGWIPYSALALAAAGAGLAPAEEGLR